MLGNIIKKELKELLTLSTLIFMISIAFMYAIIGQSIGKAVHETPQKVNIGIVNLDKGSFGELIEHVLKQSANVIYIGKSEEEGLRRLKEKNGVALIAIPEGFTQNILSGRQGKLEIVWIMRGTGIADLISTGRVQGVLGMINQEIAKKLMERYGVKDPEAVLNPFTQKAFTILKEKRLSLSPAQIGEKMSSQTTLTSIVIMMLILGAGGSVISSMGLEKENKTLETLLTLPIKRSHIVVGKIVAASIVGFIMAVIYMVGFSFYLKGLVPSSPTSGVRTDIGLNLQMKDYTLFGISLFITLLAGISLSMILGLFAENYKSSQMLSFPIVGLATFSMLLTMFKDLDTLPTVLKIVAFLIPFTHPMIALRLLMFGKIQLVVWGIVYVSVFTGVIIFIITKIFNSDRLITGRKRRRATS